MNDDLKAKGKKDLVVSALIVLGAVLCASLIIARHFWDRSPALVHTLLESMGVIISFSIFLVVWFTYDRNDDVNHAIGMGFLAVAIYSLLHTLTYPAWGYFPAGYDDLSTWFYFLGRITLVIALLSGTCSNNVWKNRWVSLFIVLVLVAGNAALLFFCYPFLPALRTTTGLTPIMAFMTCSIVSLSLLALLLVAKVLNLSDAITHKYICLALLLFIPADLCIFAQAGSFFIVFGHLFRLVFYYCLLKVVFATSVIFPYEQLADERRIANKVLDDIPTGIIRYDRLRKSVFANTRSLEILGCEIERIQNLAPQEIITQFFNDSILGKKSSGENTLKGVILELQNFQGRIFKIKADYYQLDNSFLVLFDEANKALALENLQLHTQAILNSVNNIVLVADSEETIVMCNQALADMLGLSAQDIAGLSLPALYKRFSIERKVLASTFESCQNGQRTEELSFFKPEGAQVQILVQETPVCNKNGEYLGKIIVGNDSNLLCNEQQKMQQTERLVLLGQTAAGIVHEIKNPLAVIKGFSQIISMTSHDARIKEYMKQVNRETEYINKVVGDFLKFARLRQPDLKKVFVAELLEFVTIMIDSNTYMQGIKTEFETEDSQLSVMADSEQIKQVILNIVNNAIEAMEETPNPRLSIRSGYKESTNEVYIAVANNGKALTPAEIAKLGTPFYTTKEKGTGLGLSICYQIIKEHNGRIGIESEYGQETVFTIYLPRHTDGLAEREDYAAV